MGRRKGWGGLAQGSMVAYQTRLNGERARELTIGKVIVNHRVGMEVILQPYKGVWVGARVVHKPLYQTPEGYTTAENLNPAKETIRYEALVLQVEQLAGGELAYGCSRRLSLRGWGLQLDEEETLRRLQEVRAQVRSGAPRRLG